jgi:hypothetical protein
MRRRFIFGTLIPQCSLYQIPTDIVKKNIEVIEMKKTVCIAILLLVFASMFCGIVAAAEEPVSAGPAPNSGDGTPGIDQNLKPEIPGIGPAPNSGDGVSDGSGF